MSEKIQKSQNEQELRVLNDTPENKKGCDNNNKFWIDMLVVTNAGQYRVIRDFSDGIQCRAKRSGNSRYFKFK